MKRKNSVLLFLKRIVLLSALFLMFCPGNKLHAQYDPLHEVDSQLRVLFAPLCLPDTPLNYLHDMAAHVLADSWFTDNCLDTTEMDTWYKLMEEMRRMAYDTTLIPDDDTIFFYGNKNFAKDTVVMNLMAYNFYKLHDSALTTDTFFNFDTTNYTITEKFPCELNPFVKKRVFSACPNSYYLPFSTITYRIDEDFIFHDQYNEIDDGNWRIEIDFGDGMGWQMIPPPNGGNHFHYTAYYTASGPTHIKTRVFNFVSGTYVLSGIAQAIVPPVENVRRPDEIINFNGATVGIYRPCEESGEPLKKNILVLEGYDPLNSVFMNRTVPEIYDAMIDDHGLDDLLNFGYTYLVVDWHDSKRSIVDNSATLQHIITWLKCQQMTDGDTGTLEQFVIIAESMGGLVARHALCYMEKNWMTSGGCLNYKMHNTRLLITYDSPHAGANMPLAYQHFYRDAAQLVTVSPSITQRTSAMLSNALIDGTAVKQMLLYHVDTRNALSHQYTEHPERTLFKANLALLGDYPEYTKMVAIANGSLEGHNQQNVMNLNPRTPNDYFINYDNDLFVQILGQEIKVAGLNFELKSAPNGSGNLLVLNRDHYRPTFRPRVQIRPRWPFPPRIIVTFTVGSAYFFSTGITRHANSLKPYDVIPGSVEDYGASLALNEDAPQGSFGLSKGFINIFFGSRSPVFDRATGTWSLTTMGAGVGRGTNGYRGFLNSTMYSDGFHFSYIPVFSAIDYNLPGNNYNLDIRAENIATKTAATPFDVFAGNVDHSRNTDIFEFNLWHVWTRNDFLGSFINDNPSFSRVNYDSCQDNPHPAPVRFLNREIGDDTLWINNRSVAWSILYDAEKYIGVDTPNPYYESPNLLTSRALRGIYTQDDPYNPVSGVSVFMVRHNTSNIYIANQPVPYAVMLDTIDWFKCCAPQGLFKPGSNTTSILKPEFVEKSDYDFRVFPNPYSNGELALKLFNTLNANNSVVIYDALGRKLFEKSFDTSPAAYHIEKLSINRNSFTSGTYYVIVNSGTKQFKQLLVIQ